MSGSHKGLARSGAEAPTAALEAPPGLSRAQSLAALRAAGEATRLRILALLAGVELNVKDLTQILGQSQPRISRHLKLMAEAGLIKRFREGSWVFFRLADSGAEAVLAGAIVASRGRKVKVRNAEAKAAFEREQAQKRSY